MKGIFYSGMALLALTSATLLLHAEPKKDKATGRAMDFTSVEYYPAPNELKMKTRLSGADGQPLPGGLLHITEMKLETFAPDGKPDMIVEAPDCVYDTMKATATSPGPLALQHGDGKFHVTGVGFFWRQSDSFLAISNQVHSVFDTETKDLNLKP